MGPELSRHPRFVTLPRCRFSPALVLFLFQSPEAQEEKRESCTTACAVAESGNNSCKIIPCCACVWMQRAAFLALQSILCPVKNLGWVLSSAYSSSYLEVFGHAYMQKSSLFIYVLQKEKIPLMIYLIFFFLSKSGLSSSCWKLSISFLSLKAAGNASSFPDLSLVLIWVR